MIEHIRLDCIARKAELNLTYEQIAQRAGLPVVQVRDFCFATRKRPYFTTVFALCGALGMSIDTYFPPNVNIGEGAKQADALRSVRDNPDSTPGQKLEAVKLLMEVNK